MPQTRKELDFDERYRDRLVKAMEFGHFPTDRSLAIALTRMLQELGLKPSEYVVPEQTIQSARTRVKGIPEYTLHIAFLCRVNPFWLAFGEGRMTSELFPKKHRKRRDMDPEKIKLLGLIERSNDPEAIKSGLWIFENVLPKPRRPAPKPTA